MIEYRTGDLLESGLPAIAHGCNCKGVMGAGIAKQIKAFYSPGMFDWYQFLCEHQLFLPGDMRLWIEPDKPILVNLATQYLPGRNAELKYIEFACKKMIMWARCMELNAIGMPKVGCGIGGLQWEEVEKVLDVPENFNLIVYSL